MVLGTCPLKEYSAEMVPRKTGTLYIIWFSFPLTAQHFCTCSSRALAEIFAREQSLTFPGFPFPLTLLSFRSPPSCFSFHLQAAFPSPPRDAGERCRLQPITHFMLSPCLQVAAIVVLFCGNQNIAIEANLVLTFSRSRRVASVPPPWRCLRAPGAVYCSRATAQSTVLYSDSVCSVSGCSCCLCCCRSDE